MRETLWGPKRSTSGFCNNTTPGCLQTSIKVSRAYSLQNALTLDETQWKEPHL